MNRMSLTRIVDSQHHQRVRMAFFPNHSPMHQILAALGDPTHGGERGLSNILKWREPEGPDGVSRPA